MKFYLKNLDGLRFIAAILVIFHHCNLFKISEGLPIFSNLHLFIAQKWGYLGVSLFFVLSGFLITLLLLKEHDFTKTINIKNFYLRRFFRIAPLYFGFGLVALFFSLFLSSISIYECIDIFFTNVPWWFLLSINLQLIANANSHIVEILWSVCIEEHFYLLWAPLLFFFRQYFWKVLLSLCFISLLFYFFFYFYAPSHWHLPYYYFTACRFELLCLGAAAAYLFNYHQVLLLSIFSKAFQFLILVLCFFTLSGFSIANIGDFTLINEYFYKWTIGILSASLILITVLPNSIVNLEYKWLKYGGMISYGLYVFHPFIARFTLLFISKFTSNYSVLVYEFCYPILVLGLSIIIASLSYYLYENPFLHLRKKYQKISKD